MNPSAKLRSRKIGRIEIVLAGYPDQSEQAIAAGISEGSSEPVWRCRFADRANRPIRRHPFAGGVNQRGGEADEPSILVDCRCLNGRNLVLAQAFADDI